MKILVPQLFAICILERGLLCCSCWFQGFAVHVFRGMAHMPSAQSHRRLEKETPILTAARGEREKQSLPLSLSWLYQPSGVRILPRDTWEPIKHIPIFLITIVNIPEARSPVFSGAAQTTGTLTPLRVCNSAHLQLLLRNWQERGRDNWKTAYY